jgi:hypothetical protein
MSSREYNAEHVEILLLSAQSALSSFQIRHVYDNADASKDRITVKADKEETEMTEPDGITPLVIRIPVEITAHLVTKNAAKMDTIIAAITSAQTSGATAAVTLATSAFPNGCQIRLIDGGEREQAPNTRIDKRTVHFVVTL